MEDGYLWPSTKPGWGIEIDEKAAAKFPFQVSGDSGRAPSSGPAPRSALNGGWGEVRKKDGQIIKQ